MNVTFSKKPRSSKAIVSTSFFLWSPWEECSASVLLLRPDLQRQLKKLLPVSGVPSSRFSESYILYKQSLCDNQVYMSCIIGTENTLYIIFKWSQQLLCDNQAVNISCTTGTGNTLYIIFKWSQHLKCRAKLLVNNK